MLNWLMPKFSISIIPLTSNPSQQKSQMKIKSKTLKDDKVKKSENDFIFF